ncbi:histidine phosphatase family protein [Nocardia nepalensis]|uniref:histidine phosphatase family protein n=1 Tax=Nocardia nepalensis TaxID=3375448 RepID=UPI003B672A1D
MADSHTTNFRHSAPQDHPTPRPATQAQGLRLILVRHGESWSNIDGTVAGEHTCRGLTDIGNRQARAVAEHLAAQQERLAITTVYSTPVRRAVQTAEPIAHRLGVSLRPEFPYHQHGTAEGQRRHQISPDPTLPPRQSPDDPLAPGADSWATAVHRVARMLDILATRHRHDTVVLTCHRETILAAAQHFQRTQPTLNHATAEADYTSITEWKHRTRTANPHHWRWVLVRHNDTRHLEQSSIS